MRCRHVSHLLRPVGVEELPALHQSGLLDLVFKLLSGDILAHIPLSIHVKVQEACVAHDAYA